MTLSRKKKKSNAGNIKRDTKQPKNSTGRKKMYNNNFASGMSFIARANFALHEPGIIFVTHTHTIWVKLQKH